MVGHILVKNGKHYIPKEYTKKEWLEKICDKKARNVWIYSEEKANRHKQEWVLKKIK